MQVFSSILDFPRKTLSEDLWQYSSLDKLNELPQLKPNLRYTIISNIEKYLKAFNLRLLASNLYGGAASYQWSPQSDIDVSVYAGDWPENITPTIVEKYQNFFKNIVIPFLGYEIHLFLKPPHEKNIEVADAVYDVLANEWVLPPLILPRDFDPDEYFKPFIKVAESKIKKIDQDLGKLRRSWKTLKNASQALLDSREPDLVKERVEKEKGIIRNLTGRLSDAFIQIRERRYALHDRLREKLAEDKDIGRMARFQEPEIVWKYLDRSGYVDFLYKLYRLQKENQLDKILEKY